MKTLGNLDPPPGAGQRDVAAADPRRPGRPSTSSACANTRASTSRWSTSARGCIGASSEVIESQVTKPLEDSIAGIDGVDIMTSVSRTESSQITVRFKLSKDPDTAAAEVRDRVARVRGRLPDAVDEPVIAKVEADATPTIWLAYTSETMSPLELTDIINRVVKPRLQTIPGVADVQIGGDRKYAMRIWVDPDRLAAYRLTVQDVEDALRRQNLEVPAGRIESQQREFSVTARTDLNTVAQFNEIALKTAGGYTVRLRDVARVEEAAANERSRVRLNGVPSHQHRHHPQRHRQPAGSGRRRARADAADPARPAAVGDGGAGQRQLGLHRPLDQGRLHHGGRGRGAGGAGGVRLPAHAARVDHPAGDDPGQPDRRLRAHRAGRLHRQHADAAGAGAGHRPGGRRRDRGAGEHLPPHRGRA